MTEKETNEKIETEIDKVNRAAMALRESDWSKLSQQLHDLRRFLHDFEYWLDEQIRDKTESEAKEKAAAMIAAGHSFEEIVLYKVALVVEDGEIKLRREVRNDDDIPF